MKQICINASNIHADLINATGIVLGTVSQNKQFNDLQFHICYSTFWSGVAGLSAGGGGGGGQINRNTMTKGGIKCLLPLIGCCVNCHLRIPKQGDACEPCANVYPSS